MKLFHAAASPFVRKVLVVAHETGTFADLNLVDSGTAPTKTNADLAKANPLAKIPALQLEDGTTLFDSRVCCEYLDSRSTGARMFPENGSARWEALRLQALADGLMDAAVITRYETFLRPEDKRWPEWIEGQLAKVDRSLDDLESRAGSLGARVDIGTISVGCALGYLDFRYGDRDWRKGRSKLAAWYEGFARRSSMKDTAPPSA